MCFPLDRENLGFHDVQVDLLGPVRISNRWGRVEENRSTYAKTWMLIKYLLTNNGREVYADELEQAIAGEGEPADSDQAARTRLSRARKLLDPLQLGGRKGLLLFSDGKYSLNPMYDIHTDEQRLAEHMRELKVLPVDNAEGLTVCAAALELLRGPYMDSLYSRPWIDRYRAIYSAEFVSLAQEILTRSEILNDTRVVPLLCRRAPTLAPDAEELHKALVSFLTGHKMEIELVRYISQLAHSGAAWLEEML